MCGYNVIEKAIVNSCENLLSTAVEKIRKLEEIQRGIGVGKRTRLECESNVIVPIGRTITGTVERSTQFNVIVSIGRTSTDIVERSTQSC